MYIYICLYMHAQEQVHMCIYECLGALYMHDYIVCIIYAYYMCIYICLHMHAQELYIRVFRGPEICMNIYYVCILYIHLHMFTYIYSRTGGHVILRKKPPQHGCTSLHRRTYMHIKWHACTCIYTCIRMYMCMYVCICICM